MNDMLEFHAK